MSDVLELSQRFRTRKQCLKFLEQLRFPDKVACLRCGSIRISRIKTVDKFQCLDCRYMFSVTSGTIFHRSHLPLQKWIIAIFLMCNAKKGISAKQIERDLHVTYKTAWYLMHRIRRAMKESSFMKKFTGIVEADETYVGGRRHGKRGRGAAGKTVVLGARERTGQVRAITATDVKRRTISTFIKSCVDQNAEMLIADCMSSDNPDI